jgi:hypothetical protein
MLHGVLMKNSIEFYIQFDYKGKTLRPTLTVDLDEMMQQGSVSNLYPLLARKNGIGLYSYELEIMESLPLKVAAVVGMAAEFVQEEQFDQSGFEVAWHTEQARSRIEEIAQQHVSSDLLIKHPELMDALLAVYALGKEGH